MMNGIASYGFEIIEDQQAGFRMQAFDDLVTFFFDRQLREKRRFQRWRYGVKDVIAGELAIPRGSPNESAEFLHAV